MNTLGIHICLTGNFDNYTPNSKQLDVLIPLCKDIMKRRNIPISNIKRHTDYAHYKSCPGTKFPFEWLIQQIYNKDNDFISAINKLADRGVIDSPDYWIKNKIWKQEYMELLIKKVAAFIG